MSMRPKAACASLAIWRMLPSSRTSSSRPTTLRPSPSISFAKASVSSFLRAVMIRSAPARARARPKYCPRPRLAPVTRATRPDRSKKFFTMGLPVRLEEDLHQAGLLAVQPLEPAGPILQGGLGRDEAVDVDLARGDELEAFGVLAAGGARSLEPDLPGHHLLQRQRDVAGQVPD